jgi:hypothetical protein
MRGSRWRYSKHPLTQCIDAAIDRRKLKGLPCSVGTVSDDLVTTVPGPLMITEFRRLIGGRVNARMKARGELIVDDLTWERKTDRDVDDLEFSMTVKVKTDNLKAIAKHLAAERAVEKFLRKEAAKLGRRVTMGEFEQQIDAIYAKHGV